MDNRKMNRLAEYDYSANGMYFITICAKDRVTYFSEIIMDTCDIDDGAPKQIVRDGVLGAPKVEPKQNVGDAALGVPQIKLTQIGRIVDENIRKINSVYKYVSVEKYVVMPDHIHMILFVSDYDTQGTPGAASPTKSVPLIVNALKTISSKQAGFHMWQRSYHDHIIRSRREFGEIWQYIENNPINWANHKFNQNLWR